MVTRRAAEVPGDFGDLEIAGTLAAMRLRICGIASIVFLALAPAASAGQRYAAPAGTGSECTQEKPCELKEAVGAAKAGEEVIVTSGTYELKGTISAPPVTNVQIHGDLGGPMPKINAAFGGPVFGITQTGDSLSYLDIEDDANGGIGASCFSGRLERIRVRTVGAGATGAFSYPDCVIRNSIFRVEGPGSVGLSGVGSVPPGSAVARNVTAIASGGNSFGVSAEYNEPVEGGFTLELLNSIAQGGEADLKATAGAKGAGNIVVSHSNFNTSKTVGEGARVIDGGGNQTAPPLFVDAENRNYHEAAGSPTIDAGIAGELGPLDLEGNPRILGPAPDLGAYETSNPVPAPAPVAQLESLKLSPSSFRAAKSGGAVASAKKKSKGPVGTTVTYSLSVAGKVDFTVEQLTAGRRVGKKCVKQTPANKGKKQCDLAKPLKGDFSGTGAAGQNRFKFTGRLGSKALKAGRYRLAGSAGDVVKLANFKIVG
jgi:hypothetical protein